MPNNPLRQLQSLGQSVWLDYIRRDLIEGGELRRLVEEDGLRGITSNPAIFERAIAGSEIYTDAIREMALHGHGAMAIYESLSQGDVQLAADELRPIYESTEGTDGYASLEVNPHLANDTRATVEEARRLWAQLARRNVMIKVPATSAGLAAIRQLTLEGINVNVTLIFGVTRYREVAKSFLDGLEARAANGDPLRYVTSVASFFVSRIDSFVDPLLDMLGARAGDFALAAKQARGRVAIASARCAYAAYREMFADERFARLSGIGGRPQRLLWASTSTKDPTQPDTKYVEALAGAETVATLAPDTLAAYRDHGSPRARLDSGAEEAAQLMASLPRIGISIEDVAIQLEREAIAKFTAPFDNLLAAISAMARTTSARESRQA